MTYFLGLDLGQRRDHSALAIIRRDEQRRPWGEAIFQGLAIVYAHRIPLGTPYPEIVEMMREAVATEPLYRDCELVVDATGVGAPVVELLRTARLGCRIASVTITGGERESTRECSTGSEHSVPKRDLIAALQLVLEKNEIRIAADIKDLGSLIEELVNVRNTAKENGRERIGADRAGEHDDLVIAVSLAVWKAMKKAGTIGERNIRLHV